MLEKIKKIFTNKDKELELKEKELKLKEKELELKEKEIINTKENKSEETKQEETTKPKKNNYYQRKMENIKKGREFEKFVLKYYKDKGYLVDDRAKRLKKKDNGIDIIVKKDDKYILIQCKNYSTKGTIKQDLVRKFNGDCWDIISNNESKLNKDNTKFIFAISNLECLHTGAIEYFKDERNKCRYKIFKFSSNS